MPSLVSISWIEFRSSSQTPAGGGEKRAPDDSIQQAPDFLGVPPSAFGACHAWIQFSRQYCLIHSHFHLLRLRLPFTLPLANTAPTPPAVSLAPIALMSDAGGSQRSVSAPPLSQSTAAAKAAGEFTKLSAEFFFDREFVLAFGNLHRCG